MTEPKKGLNKTHDRQKGKKDGANKVKRRRGREEDEEVGTTILPVPRHTPHT